MTAPGTVSVPGRGGGAFPWTRSGRRRGKRMGPTGSGEKEKAVFSRPLRTDPFQRFPRTIEFEQF